MILLSTDTGRARWPPGVTRWDRFRSVELRFCSSWSVARLRALWRRSLQVKSELALLVWSGCLRPEFVVLFIQLVRLFRQMVLPLNPLFPSCL